MRNKIKANSSSVTPEERAAVEKRLERFLQSDGPIDDEPLPVNARIELLKQDREIWNNTLKHHREMYALASSVKDDQRKDAIWKDALRCIKWKEALDRKIAELEKQAKKPVEVTEGNPVIEE